MAMGKKAGWTGGCTQARGTCALGTFPLQLNNTVQLGQEESAFICWFSCFLN
jgi:hypothetical protein